MELGNCCTSHNLYSRTPLKHRTAEIYKCDLNKQSKRHSDNSQSKLDSASEETNKIIEQAKKDSENLI